MSVDTGQVTIEEAIATAQADRDQALDAVDASATDGARAAADRIIDEAAATGEPFSANDLRHRFDLAQVPTPLRGARIRHALKDRKVIEPLGEVTSSDRGTHGKRIALYRGTARARAGR